MDFTKITNQVIEFTKTQITNLTQTETAAIDEFIDQKTYNPTLIDQTRLFHEKIGEYPATLWALKNPTV